VLENTRDKHKIETKPNIETTCISSISQALNNNQTQVIQMDLQQSKLTRTEWDSVELPVSHEEKEILTLIMQGYKDINIKKNKTMSMLTFLKIDVSQELHDHLFRTYFEPVLQRTMQKYGRAANFTFRSALEQKGGGLKKLKSIDQARIQNLEANLEKNKADGIIYEYVLLELCHELCKYFTKDTRTVIGRNPSIGRKSEYSLYLYTIIQLRKSTILHVNPHVLDYANQLIAHVNAMTDLCEIIERAYEFIECNKCLLEYADKELFPHQKELFSIFNRKQESLEEKKSRLVLYIAPTGTGKTLSPLGLSAEYRVIFVCGARHIGLALAKSAISMEKRIAFAFGCETATDIRLHYFAAVDFTKDRRSGGIRKVDNSNGTKVEIMICDVKSYLTAMHYMLAFNHSTQIITYWDEPTITMDYTEHELHGTIHKNWTENLIPNLVLSCATLPSEEELMPVLMDFREKFQEDGNEYVVETHTITSYDCKKSIPVVTKDGFCAMPHTMYESYGDLAQCVRECEENKTLLRYFDLSEIVKFLFYVNQEIEIDEELKIREYFKTIDEITMNSLKLYYLEVLKRVGEENWAKIYNMAIEMRKTKFANGSAGLLATTTDAHTLTDGPTIFLCEEVAKIGNFYIQQSKIPAEIFQKILQKIARNNELSESIAKLEKVLEDAENKDNKQKKSSDDESKSEKKERDIDSQKNSEIFKMHQDIDMLKKQVLYISMDAEYIPNTKPHQEKWMDVKKGQPREYVTSAFVPTIDEMTTREIMSLQIDNYLKVLLLLGIGMFIEGVNPKYLELMKTLAVQQDLYMIIASSDYVYGTNYSFCHGFLGKDMGMMTRQKTLQCMGRIGRGQIQQSYTIRFRDDEMIYGLFRKPVVNLEAENMCRLFASDY